MNTMEQQKKSEDSNLIKIRSEILNSALIVLSFASIPILIAGYARPDHLVWQPYLYVMFVVALLIWVTTLWRNTIPFQTRAALFLCSLYFVSIIGFWSTGLAGGSTLGFIVISIMATVLLGPRWGWFMFAVIALAMIVTVMAIAFGIRVYTFDVSAYVVNPKVLIYSLILVFSALAILTVILSKFHNFLYTSASQANERAAQLTEEITVRQDTEKAREKIDEKFHRIVENFQDVYFETGMDGKIRYCSPSCLVLSGYTHDELIGKNTAILYNNPDDRKQFIVDLKNEEKVRGIELVFKNKDGSLYNVELNADVLVDEQRNPTGMFGTIRDVTLARKAKEQLQRAEKMEAIGLMAGGVAHDLNNILSAIVGYPDLMLMTLPEDSELRKPLEVVKESGHRAAEIVADLLTVSKGAAAVLEIHDIHALIDEYLLSPEYQKLEQLYPEVQCKIVNEARESIISCSAVHMKKCLMNLVNNAAEAIAGHGTISITTTMQEIDSQFSKTHNINEGIYVVLAVKDDGHGIDETELGHIFEPFYTKKNLGRSGTGLGLAIVWNTVKNHNGAITVSSSSEGTCFHLYFPLQSRIVTDETSIVEPPQEVLGKGESVLVVDDEAVVLDIASMILKTHGYQVFTVKSGEEAVTFLKDTQVDLVLLDMLMDPGINGQQTYKQILKFSPDQKALISSGFSENEEVQATLQLGASQFIKKPYTKEQLCLAVRHTLDV